MSTRTLIPRSAPRKHRDTWPSCSFQTETPIASAGGGTSAYSALSVFRSVYIRATAGIPSTSGRVRRSGRRPNSASHASCWDVGWSARSRQLVVFSGVVSMAGYLSLSDRSAESTVRAAWGFSLDCLMLFAV